MFFDYKTQLQIHYKKTRNSGTCKIKKLILNLYLSIFLILLTNEVNEKIIKNTKKKKKKKKAKN